MKASDPLVPQSGTKTICPDSVGTRKEAKVNYAVDLADISETRVARREDSESPTTVVLKSFEDKIKFLEKLKEGDQVWMELGGAGDIFAQVALRNGATVARIPPFLVKDAREVRSAEKKEDHLLLASLSTENPEFFYPMTEVDEAIVRLRVLIRARSVVQRTVRIRTQQRLIRVYRDLYFVDDPEEALDAYLKEQVAKNPIFQGAAAYEKDLTKEITSLLKVIPVYGEVFEPIRGCGPVIGGTLIARIVDIRRFKTLANLTAYAGYHLRTNGQVFRQKRGDRSSWDHGLKQAVWNFTDVTNRQPEDTPWRAMLLARKAYERSKHPEPEIVESKKLYTDGHIHNRALRYVGQKFLRHIWREWRKFEGLVRTG